MTVLLVRPRASGGLAAHVDQEHQVLAGAGVAVHASGVEIQERPHPVKDLRTVRRLRQEIRELAPVSVHAHGLRAGALAALATPHSIAGPDGHRVGLRLVVTLHNRTIGSLPVRVMGGALLRILARRADTVLAVSPDLAESASRAGARDVRHAIVPAPSRDTGAGAEPPGYPSQPDATSMARGSSDQDDSPLSVLVISRLAAQKGLDDLLAAAAILTSGADAASDIPAHFFIAGDGPRRSELTARVMQERLPVTLLGWRQDIPALLARADLVVSAALWEGQPVSLQEALRAGRAIVATDAGGTRWVTGQAARLVPVGDAAALAAAILEHTDPSVRAQAERASRRRARELPGPDELLAQLRDVLVGCQDR